MTTPERVIADALDRARVLRAEGHVAQAGSIETVCAELRKSPLVADLETWISETEAVLRSGKSRAYFYDRRDQWAEDGYAERRGRAWYYRRAIVPRSKLSSIQRTQAARGTAARR